MIRRDAVELRRAAVRLAVQFTALIIVLLALMGGLLFSIVAASTAEATNKALADATRIDSPHDAPLGVFVSISDDHTVVSSKVGPPGLPDTSAMDRVARTGFAEHKNMSSGGRTFEVLTTVRGDKVVQAAVDTHEGRESLDRLVWAMLVVIAASTVLAAATSAWMARRIMRPLAESLALQRRFVADASHELRTPLTLLSTRAQLLLRKMLVADADLSQQVVSTEVSHIVDDSKLLTGILDDMLVSADPRDAADHTPVDLTGIATNAMELVGPQALQRNIKLEMEDPAGYVTVQGSPVALLRVFTSLLSNALDHAQSKVRLSVTNSGNQAFILVSDDGPGFDTGAEKRVFERFASARRRSSEADATRHYGLGLALAAEIVAHHKGTIRIDPAPPDGGGTVFVVLPLARD